MKPSTGTATHKTVENNVKQLVCQPPSQSTEIGPNFWHQRFISVCFFKARGDFPGAWLTVAELWAGSEPAEGPFEEWHMLVFPPTMWKVNSCSFEDRGDIVVY